MNPITNDLAKLRDDAANEQRWIEERLAKLEEKRQELLVKLKNQELRIGAIDAIMEGFGVVVADPRMAAHLARCREQQAAKERQEQETEDSRGIPF